jgi:hypothetical protein
MQPYELRGGPVLLGGEIRSSCLRLQSIDNQRRAAIGDKLHQNDPAPVRFNGISSDNLINGVISTFYQDIRLDDLDQIHGGILSEQHNGVYEGEAGKNN